MNKLELFYIINICISNLIYFPEQLGTCSPIRVFMEEVIIMSTYEEFMVILTAGILLVSILEFAIHKK